MIPKKIHYCWFGRTEKSDKVNQCISSWKKHCPDYEITEWNEDNFDIDAYPYAKYCYENKKWAFLSDFARLVIVAEHGGLYFDTDVEIVKPFDDLLQYGAFFGFENHENVNTGEGFGAEKGHPTVMAMQQQYLDLVPDEEGHYPTIPCPALNTKALLPFGLQLNGERQSIAGAEILPVEYLNPYDDPKGILHKTSHTYSIHWYSKSWLSKRVILRSKLTRPLHRLFGTEFLAVFRRKRS